MSVEEKRRKLENSGEMPNEAAGGERKRKEKYKLKNVDFSLKMLTLPSVSISLVLDPPFEFAK